MKAQLEEVGVVPVIVIENAHQAVDLAKALVEGGLPIIEVTMRTQAAALAIESIAKHVPKAVVGAGTVLDLEQLAIARDSGAQFMVSPGLNRPVVEESQALNLPIFPGIATATELQAALGMGLEVVKFFPAELVGGAAMLKAFGSVFKNVRFMPTGGVTPANLADYLSLPSVSACGGSWLAPSELLATGDFAGISKLAAQAREIATITRLGK